MSARTPLVFKVASEDWEFEQIHRLNYRTFVEEIPQHAASPAQRLVDKFHAENTYLICLAGRTLAGMLAVRGKRPFSLDQKLKDLDSYLPAGRKICEIRLLAVEKQFRGAINVGTGIAVAVEDIARRLGNLLGRLELIEVMDPPAPDPFPFVVADNTRLLQLGWRQEYDLDRSLRNIVASVRDAARATQP